MSDKGAYFYLSGEPVVKKNNRPIFTNSKTKRPFVGKGPKLVAAEKDIKNQILAQWKGQTMTGYLKVTFQVFLDHNRVKDVTNCWEIYADCLQDMKVIGDDNQIVHITQIKWRYPKGTKISRIIPGVSILIEPFDVAAFKLHDAGLPCLN